MRTNKKHLFIIPILAAAALLLLAAGCSHADAERVYLTTRAELMKALAEDKSEIYVGDIEFDENDLYVQISRSVKLIGRPEGSTLGKGVFLVSAPELESKSIKVSFENIVFDGRYDMPDGDPLSYPGFADMHGDRTGKTCFTLSGQLDIAFKNCTFRRYCSKYAPAIYVSYSSNGADVNTHVDMTVKDCTFEKNVAEKGVVWFNGKHGSESDISISDTVFRENRVYTGVVTLGNVKGTLDKVTVKNNIRTVYGEKNTFTHAGGGLHIANSDLLIKDCVIDGNSAPNGGGVAIAAASVILDGCSIINNSADGRGGGLLLYSSESCPVYVTNCFISGNTAKEEGAAYVWPADQINIGVPTGITEFSFCTFENNRSDDEERLVFHPIITESPDTTVGRDGKIDFYACRITDPKVTGKLKNGENSNIINGTEKGDPVPLQTVTSVAGGYYAGVRQKLYAGINEIQKPLDARAVMIAVVCVICAACMIAAVILLKARKKPKEPAPEPDAPAAISGPEKAENTEPILQKIAAEKKLTARELDVLREYISGKTRSQIAETLFISDSTVKNHISNIFSKLGVKGKDELLAIFFG